MMIKVNGELLDFNGEIEVERQVKLFDDVTGLNGDFSYTFEIPNTGKNRGILGINAGGNSISRAPYEMNDSEIINDNGISIYEGSLRVTRVSQTIEASFFARNSNWFMLLNVPLRNSFYWANLNTPQSTTTIRNSQTATSGIVWPMVNTGALSDRKSRVLYEEDMQPFIYVKDIIKTVLNQNGIKLEGDVIDDTIYNNLITTNAGQSGIQDLIKARSVYIGLSASQVLVDGFNGAVEFDKTTGPYSNSERMNWDTSTFRYVADEDYKEITFEYALSVTTTAESNTYVYMEVYVYVDGVPVGEIVWGTLRDDTVNNVTNKLSLKNVVAAGSVIQLFVRYEVPGGTGNGAILTSSWVKVTPVKFFNVFPGQLLPDVKASEFISQIFSLMCCMTKFDAKNRVLSTKMFKNLRSSPEIDLSEYCSAWEEDYAEYINEYAKSNLLSYSEGSDNDTEEYNKSYSIPYAAGSIDVDNDYLDDQGDLLSLDFVSSFQRDITWLGTSLPLINTVESSETDDTVDITSVTDNGDGYARFNFSGTNPFGSDQLVRLSDFANSNYEGDYRILANVATYFLLADVLYDGDSTGTVTGIEIIPTDSEDQILLLNLPGKNISDFSDLTTLRYNGADYSTWALSYFWLKNEGRSINSIREALYFDPVQDLAAYQISLIEKYYQDVERMLNDPKMYPIRMCLPETVFNSLDSFSPIRIKTKDVNAQFYLNRISGYKNSYTECVVELIKLP